MHLALKSFDTQVSSAVLRTPGWMQPVMLTATFLGQPIVLLIIAAAVAAFAVRNDKPRIALALGASTIAFIGNTILKFIFQRERPDTLYAAGMKIKSYSFPSGHSFGAMVFYGLLAYLAYQYLPQPWNIIVSVLLGVLILLIGISRIYLGAHFPSDVFAGWILGAIALLVIILWVRP